MPGNLFFRHNLPDFKRMATPRHVKQESIMMAMKKDCLEDWLNGRIG